MSRRQQLDRNAKRQKLSPSISSMDYCVMCCVHGIGRHFVWNECFFKLDHFAVFSFFLSRCSPHCMNFAGVCRIANVSIHLCFSQWHRSLFVNLNYLVALRTCMRKQMWHSWWMEAEIYRSYVESPSATRVCARRVHLLILIFAKINLVCACLRVRGRSSGGQRTLFRAANA